MLPSGKKLWTIALFTVALVMVVNVSWWVYYNRTEQLLDQLLGRRLAAVATASTVLIDQELVDGLTKDNLEAYIETVEILESLRQADSLSELFILNDHYEYLATTVIDADSMYFLAALNQPYIDSVFFELAPVAVTPSYKTGSIYLKSAFVPLVDSSGQVTAVIGVEASVDYFDSLKASRQNLYLSTALSVAGGLLFGLIFLILQRRVNRSQSLLMMNETHAYLGRMAAVVSHEIKNPLMILRASAERLHRARKAEESKYIIEEVDRLNAIVTRYLDFARAGGDDGQSYLLGERPEAVLVESLVTDLRRQIEEKYSGHKIEWITDPPEAELSIKSHPRSLRQILLNLLINGVEACLSAKTAIAVGISVEASDSSVVFEIKDLGAGMNRKAIGRAFEPFYTTSTTGSGLGLYLSRKIVEEMGGRIDIASKPNKGTTVSVKIPSNSDK